MKNIFSKLAGSVAVVAIVATVVATPASALTAADIQLLVSMGVIPADKAAAAMAALGGTTSTSTTSCGTYTRDITLGSTGADVVALQTYLESKGHLVIPTGVSKGYFGALTQTALAKYQVSMGISPAAGYFGPLTRAKVAADCSTTTPTTPGTGSDLNGDEASLESFDFGSGDDSDVEEDSSADIAEIEFDVEDGDVMLDRVDLAFANASTTSNADVWDVLEEVELVIDGDVVGSANLSDEDDYLDEDDGTVRISGIDTVLEEGETATIVVRVTAQDNIDSEDLGTFTVQVLRDGIRATDALGIQQYLPSSDSDEVDFDVEEAGEGEELKVSSSNSDPDETTLKVEDDAKSDAHTVFVFDVEAEDGDIEIDTVTVDVVTSATTSDMVADFILSIDGEEFDDWSYATGDTGTSTREIVFDVDGDFTIDADDEVEFAVMVEFKSTGTNDANYASGSTIELSVGSGAVEGEGADDESSTGSANGEEHTVATEGIVVAKSGFSDEGVTSNNDANTSKDFTFTFEVTAFEEDFYVATSSVIAFAESASSTVTFDYTYTVDSTGDEDATGVFTVQEGETETFTVVVTVSGVSGNAGHRVGLNQVLYTIDPDGVSTRSTKEIENSDFRTNYSTIVSI